MSSCCPPPPERLMVFRSGLDSGEALVLRSVLEGSGITVFLSNEHMASMGYGLKADIVIRTSDKARADELMRTVSLFPGQATRFDEDEIDDCPSCGSSNVFRYIGDVPVMMGLRKVKAFPGSPWRKCLQCGGYFRIDNSRVLGFLPLALLWGATLGAIVYGVMWLIDFLTWL